MSETEKRHTERYGLEFPVHVRWKNALGQLKQEMGTTRDMSRSGMYMTCSSPIDEGCKIDLEIDLTICAGAGTKGSVSVGGRVVRNIPPTGPDRGYGHAVVFDENRFAKP
ncbi:MAG: PilZ domain-containing protein [Desulfobacterales bacterium]|nr:MAG: PilZ domain-containing protein [Desulfobacterales bacterium]